MRVFACEQIELAEVSIPLTSPSTTIEGREDDQRWVLSLAVDSLRDVIVQRWLLGHNSAIQPVVMSTDVSDVG